MNKLIFLTLLLIFFSCKEDNSNSSPDDLLQQMESIDEEIEALLITQCSDGSQCVATPIGVKPCGGPTRFIVHSDATDQAKLDALIEEYNELNAKYNEMNNLGSDCSVVTAPEMDCISGTCQAVEN